APLAAPLADVVIPAAAAPGKMVLCIHQTTSQRAGYRKILEGWAKAGIKNVEITDRVLDDFVKTDSLAAAKSVITDLGLTPVSGAAVLQDFWNRNPGFAAQLETWKKRCEQFASLGLTKIYCPSTTNRMVTAEDYKAAPDAIREAGDVAKQYNLIGMIEFARSSTLIATLTTSLKLIREAGHPNVRPMLDCYHFWSGMGKFEDLDMLKPGELAHVHFQDTPDIPRELFAQQTRLIPGDGVAPLVRILRKLAEKGYDGALSVELFLPELQGGDPFEVATQIRTKSEKVMREANVL
ncbi:MAG: sugar phosphate isomerase/epimerase, partial [Bryobacterales bacterium]|nr:sugar phosphate isomerase/epimerase [Bryobacterales bacterium]